MPSFAPAAFRFDMGHLITTLVAVAQMLVYAAPAYLLMRVNKLNEKSISTFVTLLLYVSQPCLTFYSFQKATALLHDGVVSMEDMLRRGGQVFLLSLFLQGLLLGIAYFALRRRQDGAEWRIFVIATTLSNSGFFGVPILEAVMGQEHPEVAMFSALFSLVMNTLCWTVVSTIITRDRRYISPRKIFLNPNMISAVLAMLLMSQSYVLPTVALDMVTLLGRFSTPLCMFILGMRLSLVKPREMLCDVRQYAVVLVKNLIFPLLSFAILLPIPVEGYLKQALFILCACPAANMVLSFSEMLGKGQKTAAHVVLLSTIACALTLPLLCLLLPVLGT